MEEKLYRIRKEIKKKLSFIISMENIINVTSKVLNF